MADTVFEHALRNYRGKLPSHPAPERSGIFALRAAGRWELRFAARTTQGNLGRYPLSVVPANQHGCHVTIRDDLDPNVRAGFDLPTTTAEQILTELSTCRFGVHSLPARPWPMVEVRGREPLAHLVNRMAAPLADALEGSLKKWAPEHELVGHTREAATAEVWATIYALLSCPPQLRPVMRQQVLDQVSDVAQRKPPPQELTSAEANVAVMAIFTLSEIERLAWHFTLEHNDSGLISPLNRTRTVLMNSEIYSLDPRLVLNSRSRKTILANIGVFCEALAKAFKNGFKPLLLTVADSDVVFLPPSVRAPRNPQDLSTWWVQFPNQPMPVTLDSLPQTISRQQPRLARTSITQAQGAKTNSRQQALPGGPTRQATATAPTLDNLLGQLDALTGLAPVKAEVRQLINIVRVEQMRRATGLPVTPVSRHLKCSRATLAQVKQPSPAC